MRPASAVPFFRSKRYPVPSHRTTYCATTGRVSGPVRSRPVVVLSRSTYAAGVRTACPSVTAD